MRKIITALTALILVVGGVAVVRAETISFDDIIPLPESDGTILENYKGLVWTNFMYIDAKINDYNSSGLENSVVSEHNVAFASAISTKPTIASMYSGSFDFISAYFTAVWNDDLLIHVDGYKNGVVKYSTAPDDFYVNTDASTLVTFNWSDIDQLRFKSSGGTHHKDYINGIGTWFAIDDLVIVPEPSALVMLAGLSVVLISGFGRRRLNR